ncbi:dihydrofolate reductase [Methylobacter sp. YRD-M1]|uniref:dihydrofolate reductase n=1 Tax=Methylobacter sp. YRD-M1 TaxID=2911520 RepID=UPI00227D6A06|nr:dihydrofolate reductase [Methylobacter sp. YRD-M1]WAK02204.1 dihydrofolate reductase [Methylobacter sp. YRD-M1]
MKISLIVAMASNRVIGINNQLPWHLSADLKRFRQITMGSPILMGRKTYESIGRPLPGRTNVIISRDPDYKQEGCLVFNDIETAIESCGQKFQEIFVIGGSELYKSMLPMADTLYVTLINKEFSGDAFFPELDTRHWAEVSREDIDNDPDAGFSYSFIKYEKSIT